MARAVIRLQVRENEPGSVLSEAAGIARATPAARVSEPACGHHHWIRSPLLTFQALPEGVGQNDACRSRYITW
jgi:hypothetical protein